MLLCRNSYLHQPHSHQRANGDDPCDRDEARSAPSHVAHTVGSDKAGVADATPASLLLFPNLPPPRAINRIPQEYLVSRTYLLFFFLLHGDRTHGISDAEAEGDKRSESECEPEKRICASLSHIVYSIQHECALPWLTFTHKSLSSCDSNGGS